MQLLRILFWTLAYREDKKWKLKNAHFLNYIYQNTNLQKGANVYSNTYVRTIVYIFWKKGWSQKVELLVS